MQALKLSKIEVVVVPGPVRLEGARRAHQTERDNERDQCSDDDPHGFSLQYARGRPSTTAAVHWCASLKHKPQSPVVKIQ
jgi:hypothetical protein